MKDAVVIYSGGMDSFTLLHHAIKQHGAERLIALSFDYGQRHRRELDAAIIVCAKQGVEHRTIDLEALTSGGVFAGSALTDDVDVPKGHYEDVTMKATVVPNRNMIMLSIAVGLAEAEKASVVYYGAHSGDHAIYPDCRPEFVEAVDLAAQRATYQEIRVEAPFINEDKAGILAYGAGLGLKPIDYAFTWTCYVGEATACGQCGSCGERLEAFAKMGWTDPLPYLEDICDDA
jgi:7-cyano-7-deazaguanine synthase